MDGWELLKSKQNPLIPNLLGFRFAHFAIISVQLSSWMEYDQVVFPPATYRDLYFVQQIVEK